ncbi:MAG: hypothetical protein PHW95_01920 [Patescibacteria group bacterium]|nr:hypothetical protein [Patescibacteria group bacterium]
MNKKITKFIITAGLLTMLLLPTVMLAADNTLQGMLQDTAGENGAGYDTTKPKETALATVAGTIVQLFISLIGIIFISYTVYGGYLWMTAAGNEEKVSQAKKIIRDGIIGIIIILSAAAIYTFVSTVLSSGPTAQIPSGT